MPHREDVLRFVNFPVGSEVVAEREIAKLIHRFGKPFLAANDPDFIPHNLPDCSDNFCHLFATRWPLLVRLGPAARLAGSYGLGLSLLMAMVLAANARPGASAVDQPFQQGIAGQAVGAVDSRGRHLSGGVQSFERCGAMEVCRDSTHGVMGRRPHGEQVSRDIEIVSKAG